MRKNIFKLYAAIKKKFKCKSYEIIYVDDDSTGQNTIQKFYHLKNKKKRKIYI